MYDKPSEVVYVDETTGERSRVDEVMDLDLQQVYVTPSRFGKRDLVFTNDQIKVVDDGRAQTVVTFEQGDIPFTATLLLDASGSMQGPRLERALDGARAFMADLAPLDRARIVLAADRLRGVSPFVEAENTSTDLLAEAPGSHRGRGRHRAIRLPLSGRWTPYNPSKDARCSSCSRTATTK